MTERTLTFVNPRWIQFWCEKCGRVISDCRPAGSLNTELPTLEFIDSCAMCAKAKPNE